MADDGLIVATEIRNMFFIIQDIANGIRDDYQGTAPEILNVVFIHGPVDMKHDVRDGKITKQETVGKCINQTDATWLLVSIVQRWGWNLIHEMFHAMGFHDEKWVRQATNDFVKIHKLRMQKLEKAAAK